MPMYDEEKVLYFASRGTGLHVDADEPVHTTLSGLVRNLRQRKMLALLAEDDSGAYFTLTNAGRIRLLELQIEWRKRTGRDISNQQDELAKLQAIVAKKGV